LGVLEGVESSEPDIPGAEPNGRLVPEGREAMTDIELIDRMQRIIRAGNNFRTSNYVRLEMPRQDVADAKWIRDQCQLLRASDAGMEYNEAALSATASFGVMVLKDVTP
jgi:hypothetical protein